MLYDAFICHASEDKDEFVRPLAEALSKRHLEIWYDEFSLSVGDGLRRAIDKGLAKSRFGIVVLSPHFFRKGWAQRELDGLVARQIAEDRRLILPIWHKVTATDIVEFSPPLADTVALHSARGLDEVCAGLLKKLRPDESPLISARDELLRWGVEPPVISDEWWLDVVEASNRMSNGGAVVPDATVWGSWTFPLPHDNSSGAERGRHLAWTALQMAWSEHAERNKICQVSHPDVVHKFIQEFPGLAELCSRSPWHVACYAPQLTLPPFSGFLAQIFDEELERSIVQHKQRATEHLCDEEWSLRHPAFGGYEAWQIAHHYFSGQMFAPKVEGYESFANVVWLLSEHSTWLPENVRSVLTRGTVDWAAWTSSRDVTDTYESKGFFYALLSVRTPSKFKLTKRLRASLNELVESALRTLNLQADAEEISAAFLKAGYIEGYFERERRRLRS
ncbi:TIR domain-containing protein [Bradyrhizobium sp. STM 3562]|uniref:TIR domain-containing protein n=1 Tax=Bradyrhizobium sp. STM 3562 TaxID=578924 RepID=UPI0038903E4E